MGVNPLILPGKSLKALGEMLIQKDYADQREEPKVFGVHQSSFFI
jgi:hypothetical protein